MGLVGVGYGLVVLKVTGLGYVKANQRSFAQKALMYSTIAFGATGASSLAFEGSVKTGEQKDGKAFDPI